MKKFLALYMGTPDAFAKWKAMDEVTRKQKEKQGMDAWMQWATDNKASIVEEGSPVGKTKRIDAGGISDTTNEIGAWTLVEADSHDAAAKMFINHPHFTIFPGNRVEVMECLVLPGM